MRPERWQELDRLFHSALGREPSERAAFLDEACGGDESLHKEVESLLAGYEESASFMENPAIEVEAQSVASDQKQLAAGQKIGRYQIVSQLGVGGMGEVYLAEDITLERKVALKLLPGDFSRDTDRVRRFQQEARAASALNHPNIVTVHEIAHVGDRHLIVTEFIDGETLRERTQHDSGGAMPTREVLNVGIQIADALAAAHEAGIVHRDIKPENIMVRRRDGYIKVLDFGLAKQALGIVGGNDVDREAATRSQVKTSAGTVMGTVTYMSPEQTRGEKLDQRTDLWSLGVVLYELLAGRAPFERPSQSEVIAAILDHDPPRLADYVGEIPSELERIISKALTKDREQRYQTAKDLLIDLRQLQHCWEVEKEIDGASSREARDTQPSGTSHQTNGKARNPPFLRRAMVDHKRALIIAAVAIMVIAAVAYRSYFTTGRPAIDSIAVLPFVNVSGDHNTEYLSDGISESLINSLTELQQLRVIARATAFHYKGKDVDPQAVGRDLKVKAVLMGRVRQMGDVLNIQVDLVDATTGAQLWGREYERKVSDVLSVKQAIAREVTEKLRLGLSSEQQQQLTTRDTTNTEAYQFYLIGRYFWNKRTPEGLKKAIEQFQLAIDHDPNYALAYVGLADSYVLLEQYANIPAIDTLPKARAAVERALQIDESLAEAHASLGNIEEQSWNFDESEREYKKAIALNPNYATAHQWYSDYLRAVKGRYDEAKAEIKLAQRLDPLSLVINLSVVGAHIHTGQLDAAIEEAKKVLELYPNGGGPHFMLGYVYRKQRRYDDAIAEFEKIMAIDGRRGSHALSNLGMCYAMAGNRDKARSILKELEEQYHKGEAPGLFLASLYAVLGEKDQAFASLEKDFQVRSGFLTGLAYSQFEEANLRAALSSDPRWNDLLRRMGLPQN